MKIKTLSMLMAAVAMSAATYARDVSSFYENNQFLNYSDGDKAAGAEVMLFLLKCPRTQGTSQAVPQVSPAPQAPELEYVCELKVTCDSGFSVGQTSKGERFVIPINGGTFEGPRMKGVVLSGGADYQLIDKAKGRTELEAIYCIRTDDGVNIHIRNAGLIVASDSSFYFRTAPKFEAPNDSKYDWLNNALFVCTPGFGQGYISLKVWMVK